MKKQLLFILAALFLIFPMTANAAVKMNKTKLYLVNKTSEKLTVTGAGSVTWKSANTSIATVDQKGKVTAKKNGTTKITAKYGSKSLTCTVYVMALNTSKLELTKGEKANVRIVNAQGHVTWKSADTKIAQVTSSGTVTGVSAGITKVTGTCSGKTLTCTVYIPELQLNKTEFAVGERGKATVKNTISSIQDNKRGASYIQCARG